MAKSGSVEESRERALLTTVLAELGDEYRSVIKGVLVASSDGSSLVGGTPVGQADLVASMSALASGTAAGIVDQVAAGQYAGCLIEGSSGYVAVYPLAPYLVLVMISHDDVTPGLFMTTTKTVLARLRPVAARTETRPTARPAPVAPPGLAVSLKDIPRIDLSMVDKSRTDPD